MVSFRFDVRGRASTSAVVRRADAAVFSEFRGVGDVAWGGAAGAVLLGL